MPAMIVLGDKTDHGGEVIEASGVTDTHGKRIARVGDRVYCPKKGHGTTVIVTGDITMVIDGKAVAYHGCKTSCGAMLISSQAVTTVEFAGRAGAVSATSSGEGAIGRLSDAPVREALDATPAGLHVAALLDETQWVGFRLVNTENAALSGEPFELTDPSGKKFSGELDGEGQVRVEGVRVGSCIVTFPRIGRTAEVGG
jgi:uncharacterized Zn-binding protein involved in type VI secretion